MSRYVFVIPTFLVLFFRHPRVLRRSKSVGGLNGGDPVKRASQACTPHMLDSRSAFSSASLVGNDDKDYWRSFREFLSASFLRKQESRAINNRIPAFAEMTALVIFLIFTTISPALAMTGPEEKLSDPALEKRARALYYEVRCPVCDSQSIAESNAGISTALRAHIRKSLLAGQSDEVIIAGLRQSYGNDITMTPPVNNATYALWYAPFILLIFGVIAAFVVIRTANRQQ